MGTGTFDWLGFLQRWSQELIEDAEIAETLPPEVLASGWVGYPGATAAQIAQAEARLGTRLPPSYRAFLQVSNGWRRTTPFIYKLWSTDELDWLSVRNQDLIDMDEQMQKMLEEPPVPDEQYFVYGEAQAAGAYRPEYLRTALEISEWGDAAIYLLNPMVVSDGGEWEAWFLANWRPGADRYRSFQEMMQAEYETFRSLRRSDEGS